jgi:glycosyltransferase involved in cell wall biosynthesis
LGASPEGGLDRKCTTPVMRKVLLVAPVPTHPTTSGASARVRYMAEGLSSLGHEVHLLQLQQALWTRDTAMRCYWGDHLHVYRGLSPLGLLARARRKPLRIIGKAFHLNLPVDSYFDPACAGYLRELVVRQRFDVVILSYAFYSWLFESVPDSALKLLDTLDVFSDRYRLYREHGQTGEFFSTTRQGEGKTLGRADTVLAIQEWDASHFRSLTHRPVAVVGHLAPPDAGTVPGGTERCPHTILFVGGAMSINVHGVTWFMDRVLPLVRARVPEAELWLVGGICDRISRIPSGVRRLDFVDVLRHLYLRAAVVINPQQFGTGLSIKSVDALRHARPLVTTPSGARGIEAGAGEAFWLAGSAEEFGEHIVELLRNPARAAALADRAAEYSRQYYGRNLQALSAVVSEISRRP